MGLMDKLPFSLWKEVHNPPLRQIIFLYQQEENLTQKTFLSIKLVWKLMIREELLLMIIYEQMYLIFMALVMSLEEPCLLIKLKNKAFM